MAIRASELDCRSLAAYLVDGITWSRLREIATLPRAAQGLELFRDGSRLRKETFGVSPSAIVSTRPETDLKFLKFLHGKEHTLHRVATKDLEQRKSLSAETGRAIVNLGDINLRISRAVLCELLERCMFLLYWNAKHSKVASSSSWDELMEKASTLILDLAITPEVLERLGIGRDEVEAMDPQPKTWVDLAVLRIVGEWDLVAEHLQRALDFHRKVSTQASAHLALLADNTFRTTWLAAKLLSTDKDIAQIAAKALVRHLASTRPSNRTHFEQHLFETRPLWENLVAFSEATPPVLLWHGRGSYEILFRFLAPRFLLTPDHVLDCERVHARWQWLCNIKRSIKMHSLNATLRLTHFLENNQAFPSDEDLYEYLEAEREQHLADRRDLDSRDGDEEIALGWRSCVTSSEQAPGTTWLD